MKLYYLDENTRRWRPAATSQLDTGGNVLTATTNHFSYYGEQADPLQNGPGRIMAAQTNLYSGTASFSYPIELPPGPGGFRPKLELTYNSGIADEMKNKRQTGSWVGIGWTLHLGQISYDDVNKKYYLDLNGGSYELISENGTTGSGTSWRTNPEQYFKITRVSTGWQDGYWEMWDKEGTYYKFGGSPRSIQWFEWPRIGEKPAENTAYRRDLVEMKDANNNRATVSYQQDIMWSAPPLAGQYVRSQYPEYLRYAGDNVTVHFTAGYDQYFPVDQNGKGDGYVRRDDPVGALAANVSAAKIMVTLIRHQK